MKSQFSKSSFQEVGRRCPHRLPATQQVAHADWSDWEQYQGQNLLPQLLMLHPLYGHITQHFWCRICHAQHTLKCTWKEDKHWEQMPFSTQSADIITFFQPCFYQYALKEAVATTQSVTQSRIEVTRHSQLWWVIQWIKYKYILYYRATQSILFTRHHIQALQQQSQL